MDDEAEPIDRIAFLSRSKPRVHTLSELLRSGPTTQRTLRERIDTSRSTMARTLTALEDRGWVREDSGSYLITDRGELVIETFLELEEVIRTTEDLTPFLRWFPFSEYDVELAWLRSSEMIPSTSGDPYAPGRSQTELLQRTECFRGLLPSLDLEGTRTVHDRIVDGELEADIVVSKNVSSTIDNDEFAGLFREQLASGGLTLRVFEGDLPFYLGIGDATVHIGVEDDDGIPRALLESTADALYRWAEEVFEEYREQAVRIDRTDI